MEIDNDAALESAGFTPGPWVIDNSPTSAWLWITGKKGKVVTTICRGWENADKNATLIAAAPEMARALLMVMDAADSRSVALGEMVVEVLRKAGVQLPAGPHEGTGG